MRWMAAAILAAVASGCANWFDQLPEQRPIPDQSPKITAQEARGIATQEVGWLKYTEVWVEPDEALTCWKVVFARKWPPGQFGPPRYIVWVNWKTGRIWETQ